MHDVIDHSYFQNSCKSFNDLLLRSPSPESSPSPACLESSPSPSPKVWDSSPSPSPTRSGLESYLSPESKDSSPHLWEMEEFAIVRFVCVLL